MLPSSLRPGADSECSGGPQYTRSVLRSGQALGQQIRSQKVPHFHCEKPTFSRTLGWKLITTWKGKGQLSIHCVLHHWFPISVHFKNFPWGESPEAPLLWNMVNTRCFFFFFHDVAQTRSLCVGKLKPRWVYSPPGSQRNAKKKKEGGGG